MIMFKSRIRQWLANHPEILTLGFLLVLKWGEYGLDGFDPSSAASGYAGP